MSGNRPDRPPRVLPALVERFVRGSTVEWTLGDLAEELDARLRNPDTAPGARAWYRRQLVRSIIPLVRDRRRERRRAVRARARRTPTGSTDTVPRPGRQSMVPSLVQDVRYSFRSFSRRPGLAITALLTLALGIGANTAVFSVVNGVLLRSLPYPEPGELVILATRDVETGDTYTASGPNFLDWSASRDVLDATYAWGARGVTLTDGDRREQIEAGLVTPDFLAVLRTPPLHGRGFLPDEGEPGGPAVVLLGHGFWKRRYGEDPAVVGTTIGLDGEPYEIIGIAPPGFEMPLATRPKEMWLPYARDWAAEERDGVYLLIVGRLGDGVTVARAQRELDAVHARILRAYPETAGTGVAVIPLKTELVSDVRLSLLMLLGAVGFLLLLACANVANLFLARAAGRGTELGVRTALGAGRRRLTRQLLTESAVVATAAGALGLLAGLGGIELLAALAPDDLPRIQTVSIDATVLAFSLAATAATALLFGAAPALYATRRDPVRLLGGAGRGHVGDGGLRRLREALVVSEIAVAAVLVVSAGLLARSFGAMLDVDPGFDQSDLVLAEVLVPPDRYPDADRRAEFFEGLMRHLEAVPAVEAAGGVWNAPMGQAIVNTALQIEGRPTPADQLPLAEFRLSTGGYFDALRIPVLAGRVFDASDTRAGPPRVVISRLLAEELWPGESPVGRRVSMDIFESDGVPRWHEVIGVVGDVRLNGLDDPERGLVYVAYSQRPQTWITVTARTRGDIGAAAAVVREEILAFEPMVARPEVTTMEGRVGETLAARRFYLTLLGAFAAIAIGLASVGIYGVLAYTVSRRTNEIGVRVAFGASRGRIVRQVVAEGMKVAGVGIGLGLAGAWAATRALRSLIYGITLTDPPTYAMVAGILAIVALLACVVPARRAAMVEPLTALRYE